MLFFRITFVSVCILGDTSTGKTELIKRFMRDTPPEINTLTTTTNYLEREIPVVGGGKVKIMMWDIRKTTD